MVVGAKEKETSKFFQTELARTLDTSLSPKNIDTLPNDEVNGIIKLIEKSIAEYPK